MTTQYAIKKMKAFLKQRDWDLYFLRMVELVSSKSRDPNTQVGCVIVGPDNEVVSTGFNGLPRGIEHTKARYERPEKYHWFEHAERNAIYNGARIGVRLKGCTLYLYGYPCPDCARAVIQAGISTVVMSANQEKFADHNERWKELYQRSHIMLREAEIQIRKVNTDTGDDD